MEQPPSDSSALSVVVTTWDRDSHDLYDYEADPSHCTKLVVSSSGKVFRVGTKVVCLLEDQECPANADYLLSIRMHEGISQTDHADSFAAQAQYEVGPAERNPQAAYLQKKLWMIVRDLPEKRHLLSENDVIKLGRCKLRVKQLALSGKPLGELKFDDSPPITTTKTVAEMKKLQCRICLGEGGTDEDPLIPPCNCKGSIGYVHVECLRQWINGKFSMMERSKNCSYFRMIRCELCRQSFPTAVKRRKDVIRLLHINREELVPPLLILENLNSPKAYYIITMPQEKDVKLGRGHDCDVRISDVSISRHHATIHYKDDQFSLKDCGSKFGTLVSIKHPLSVSTADNLVFQAGRSVLKINMLPNSAEAVDTAEEVQESNATSI